jgi:hypothetical protein
MPRVKIGGAVPDRKSLDLEIARLRGLDIVELRVRCKIHSEDLQPLTGPATSCSAFWRTTIDSRTALWLPQSPFPGNGNSRPENKGPKLSLNPNCMPTETERQRRMPPSGGFSPVAGKFPQTWDCVVGLEGLEPRARRLSARYQRQRHYEGRTCCRCYRHADAK